ncbi:hypothetical protein HYS93_02650 [Candidatus Daviesbacteria bacterium]|nr:hypothetical protein [Candidatus Daviesbacteria bacterium]
MLRADLLVIGALVIFIILIGLLNSKFLENRTFKRIEQKGLGMKQLSQSATPSSSVVPTTATTKPSPSNSTNNSSLKDWQYPGSIIIDSSQTSLVLESSADTNQITDWYKEKIRNLNMNTKTFVVTSSNNNVLNKLVGKGSSAEVKIEISKPDGSETSKITINYVKS